MRMFECLQRICMAMMLCAFSGDISAGMIDKEGMKPWEVCGLCHSADGVSRMAKFPKLAGQKAAYIEQQFMRFRFGARQNDGGQMEAITTEIAIADVAQVASYFAALPADSLLANTPRLSDVEKLSAGEEQLLARGERLFTHGKNGVTACAQCHANKQSSAPWIDGQHRDYLIKQLKDFKSGERQTSGVVEKVVAFSDETGAMGQLAKRLDTDDIDAISLYLSVTQLDRD